MKKVHTNKAFAMFLVFAVTLSSCTSSTQLISQEQQQLRATVVALETQVADGQASIAALQTEVARSSVLAPATLEESDITGSWMRVTSMEDVTLAFLFIEEIEFLRDGTFILPKLGGISGIYSFPASDLIKLEGKESSNIFRFTLSGDTLTFYDGGEAIVFRRKK